MDSVKNTWQANDKKMCSTDQKWDLSRNIIFLCGQIVLCFVALLCYCRRCRRRCRCFLVFFCCSRFAMFVACCFFFGSIAHTEQREWDRVTMRQKRPQLSDSQCFILISDRTFILDSQKCCRLLGTIFISPSLSLALSLRSISLCLLRVAFICRF